MGKNLKNADLVLRTGKVAFYMVPGNSVYTRMEGFTSLSTSKSATEYERQYVDEDFKRTDITGYNTAIAYALDRYVHNNVIDDIISIHENELLGQDAVREIIQVDMTTAEETTNGYKASAKMRQYSVIPDTDGDTTDCMTYSGNFKTRGEIEDVTVTTSDDWQTIILEGSSDMPKLTSLVVKGGTNGTTSVTLTPTFKSDTISYAMPAQTTGKISITPTAESDSYTIVIAYNDSTYIVDSGSTTTFAASSGSSDKIKITVQKKTASGTLNRTYTISQTTSSSS